MREPATLPTLPLHFQTRRRVSPVPERKRGRARRPRPRAPFRRHREVLRRRVETSRAVRAPEHVQLAQVERRPQTPRGGFPVLIVVRAGGRREHMRAGDGSARHRRRRRRRRRVRRRRRLYARRSSRRRHHESPRHHHRMRHLILMRRRGYRATSRRTAPDTQRREPSAAERARGGVHHPAVHHAGHARLRVGGDARRRGVRGPLRGVFLAHLLPLLGVRELFQLLRRLGRRVGGHQLCLGHERGGAHVYARRLLLLLVVALRGELGVGALLVHHGDEARRFRLGVPPTRGAAFGDEHLAVAHGRDGVPVRARPPGHGARVAQDDALPLGARNRDIDPARVRHEPHRPPLVGAGRADQHKVKLAALTRVHGQTLHAERRGHRVHQRQVLALVKRERGDGKSRPVAFAHASRRRDGGGDFRAVHVARALLGGFLPPGNLHPHHGALRVG
mmetsp:Transcript_7166/g.29630  ORF Transcript_7166/g.29630 Transcript_7166/m.29630 type:complete len:448 (-) Transcript_7166:2118-3461(-)